MATFEQASAAIVERYPSVTLRSARVSRGNGGGFSYYMKNSAGAESNLYVSSGAAKLSEWLDAADVVVGVWNREAHRMALGIEHAEGAHDADDLPTINCPGCEAATAAANDDRLRGTEEYRALMESMIAIEKHCARVLRDLEYVRADFSASPNGREAAYGPDAPSRVHYAVDQIAALLLTIPAQARTDSLARYARAYAAVVEGRSPGRASRSAE